MTGIQQHSDERRAENEVLFKEHNERIKSHVQRLLDETSKEVLPIGFVCECSKVDCQEKIEMPVSEYRNLRENHKQFIIRLGHESPDIERVIHKAEAWQVVEKYETPPRPDNVLQP
jgi:hypothetical protein